MDFSDYYVVPAAYKAQVAELFEAIRVTDHGKFLSVITEDKARIEKLPVAMHLHNDEWAAWGFTLFASGKQIAHGVFGENAETGITEDDNVLEGDLDEAARLLEVPAAKLHEAVESEDVELFVKYVDVPLMSVTPGILERELGKDTMMKTLIDPRTLKRAKVAAKPKPKRATKRTPKDKAKAKSRKTTAKGTRTKAKATPKRAKQTKRTKRSTSP